MDLEGLSPSRKHQSRRLEFGRSDKQYWLSWSTEIKEIISHEIHSLEK